MMTDLQLMEGVIQLAMQGNLVEQRINEGTGNDLLKAIKEEKEKMAKAGLIKKSKKSEPITEDEIPFDIPESWTWARVEDLTVLNPKNDLDDNLETSFIPMTLVSDGFSNHHTSEKRNWSSIKKGFSHFQEGDIGVAKITPCFQNRKSVIFKGLINGYGAGTTELSIVRPLHNYCCPEYLLFVFKSKLFISNGVKSFTGTAGQQRIHKDYLRRFIVPLPPLEEQKRIVAKIEELMPFVEQYAETNTKLNTLNASFSDMMKKSILQEAVQGKLVPQDPNDEPASELLKRIAEEKQRLIKEGKIKKQKALPAITEDEIPFEIPESWEWVRLNDCIDVRDGTHDSPKYHTEGYPLVTSKNLRGNGIDFSTCKLISKEDFEAINQRSKVDNGDILFAMIGTVGNPVLYHGDANFSIKNMALFKHIGDYIDMEYVYWFFMLAQHDMKKKASGGVQSFVSLGFLRNYLIPLPPIEEQHRIVKRVEEMLGSIDDLEKRIG